VRQVQGFIDTVAVVQNGRVVHVPVAIESNIPPDSPAAFYIAGWVDALQLASVVGVIAYLAFKRK